MNKAIGNSLIRASVVTTATLFSKQKPKPIPRSQRLFAFVVLEAKKKK